MTKHAAARTIGVFAALALAGCFGDSTGPGEQRPGRLLIAPQLERRALMLVNVDSAVITLRNPGTNTIVWDTTVFFPANEDTLDLTLKVPIVGLSQQFDLTIQLIDEPGHVVVFQAGPTLVTATQGDDTPPPVTGLAFTYTGTGANAAGVRFLTTPGQVFFGDSVLFTAEAFDSNNVTIPNTPIAWSSADTGKARVPFDSIGRVIGGIVRGNTSVIASLLLTKVGVTPPSATRPIVIQPRPNAIVITGGSGQTGALGAPLVQPVTVRVNAADNLGVAGVPVTFLATGTNGTANPVTDTTDANGDASTVWTLGSALGAQTLQVSVAGLAGPATVPATGVLGSAALLAFQVQPSNGPTGVAIAPAIVVAARDNFGNTIPGFTGNVTLAIGTNPGGATLGGTTTVAAVAGLATFSDITLSNIGTGYTLTAAATGLATGTSAAFTIAGGAPARLVITQEPSNAASGGAISPAITVEVRDGSNNLVPSAVNPVTINILTNPAGGALSGTAIVAAVGGVATFSNLSIDKAGTGYILEVTAGGLTSDTSVAFNITSGPATSLGFTTQPPSNAIFQSPFVTVVTAFDAAGNVATGYGGQVTLALGSNPNNGTLFGTAAVNAVAGVATFSGMSIDNVGNAYTLTANASGLAGTGSNGVVVTAPANANLWINLAGGNWSTPGNWSLGTVPGPTDTVFIRQSGSYTVNLDVNATVARLDVGGPAGVQTLQVNANTLTFGGNASFAANGRLVVGGGNVTGAGTVDFFGGLDWQGGNFSGGTATARVQPGGTLAIGGTVARTFTNWLFELSGTGTWTGTQTLNSGQAATIRVMTGGVLNIQGDPNFAFNQGGTTSRLDVQGGTVNRTTSAGTGDLPAVSNDGVFNVQSGTLNLNQGASSNGAFNVAAGAVLRFNNGAHQVTSAGSFAGAGTVQVGTTVAIDGAYNVTTTQILAGNGNFNSGGAKTTANLTVAGGTLGGNAGGLLTVSGAMTWTSGNIQGAGGTVRVLSGATLAISGTATRNLNNYLLELAGTGTWVGTHQVNSGLGAILRVLAGATLDIQGDPSFLFNQGGTGSRFEVLGTLTRTTSLNVAIMGVEYDNDAQTTITSGELRLTNGSGAGTEDGTFTVNAGATLDFFGGTHNFGPASTITGAGQLQVDAGTVNIGGTLAFTGVTTLAGGTFNYNNTGAAGSLTTLNVGGGVLGGSAGAQLTVSTAMTWSSGNITGAGGRVTVLSGATLAISGTATRNFTNHIVELASGATGTWVGTHQVNTGLLAVLRVLSGATLDVQGNPTFVFNQGGTASRLEVLGTLTRTTSAGIATMSVEYDNDAQTTVSSGTLRLSGGSGASPSDGSYAVAAGATLDFAGGTHNLGVPGSVSGAGIVQASAGTVNAGGSWAHSGTTQVNGGTLNYSAAGGSTTNLNVSSGVLGGAAGGLLSITGAMSWSGGNLTGTGGTAQVQSGGTLTISGTATRNFTNYVVEVAGGATGIWTGAHQVNTGLVAILRVMTGGSLDIQGTPGFIQNQGGGSSRLEVQGTGVLTRTVSTGTANMQVEVDNDAILSVSTGTLRLSGGSGAGTADGSYTANAGTTLEFGGGTHNLGAASTLTGSGLVVVTAGALNDAGTLSVTGTSRVTGGTFDYNGGTGNTATLDLTGGAHGGTGIVQVTTAMTWSGGNLTGSGGTTRILSSATLGMTTTATRNFTNHTLENHGTATWSGSFSMNTGLGAILRNTGTGTFTLSGDGNFTQNQGGTQSRFDNQGAFVRNTSVGTAPWSAAFDHSSGTVTVSSGTFSLTGGGTWSAPVTVTSPGFLDFTGGTFVMNNGLNATGTSAVRLQGATITNGTAADTARFANLDQTAGVLGHIGGVVVNGIFNWTGGTITGAGTTRIANIATMNVSGVATRTFTNGTILNQGTTNWNGASSVNTGAGAVWRNAAVASFTISADVNLAHNQGGGALFDNLGTLTRNTSAGTAIIDAPLNHSGTAALNVTAGVLSLTGGGTQSSGITVGAGAFLDYAANVFTLNNGLNQTGAGTVRLTGSASITNSTVADTARFTNLTMNAGVLNHIGGVVTSGVLDWAGGNIQGTGTLRIGTGTMNVTTTAIRTFINGTILNQATTNWGTTATINTGLGAAWRTAGTASFNLTGDGNLAHNQGGLATFVNLGTFARTTSAGVALIDANFIDTTGTMTVSTGTLRLSGGARLGGTKTVSLGATIDIPTGTLTMRTGAVVTGTGIVAISGGTLTPDSGGTAQITNVTLSAGQIAHEGTLTIGGTGILAWTGGNITSNQVGLGGTTVIPAGSVLNISGAATRNFLGRHSLDIAGSATWINNASIFTGLDARIQVTGIFDIQGDGVLDMNQGGADTLRIGSSGSLRRTTSAGVARLEAVLDKLGAIDVQTGTLQLVNGSVTNFAGNYTGAGTLELNGGTYTTTGNFTIPGNLTVSGGAFTFAGAGRIIGVTGNLTTATGGVVNMTTATDSLDINGNALFAGGNGVLDAGVIRLAGNFTQAGTTSFRGLAQTAVIRHRVVLDGAGTQVISWADPVNSFFEILEMQKSAGTQVQIVGTMRARQINQRNFNATTVTSLGGAITPRIMVDTLHGVGAFSMVSPLVLEVAGRIIDSGTVNVDTVVFTGANQVITDRLTLGTSLYQYHNIRVAQTTGTATLALLSAPLALTNDLVVSNGSLSLSGFRANVAGNFATLGAGSLTMTNANDTLDVAGNVSFGGVTGTMNVGGIRVAGNFNQSGATNSFTPTGTHKVYFDGVATQNITFASGTSFFRRFEASATGTRNIVLQSNVTVTDSLTMLGGGSGTDLIGAGTSQRLIVNGIVRLTQSTASPRLAPPVLELVQTPNIDPIGIAGRGMTPDTTVYNTGVVALPVGVGIRYNSIRISTNANFAMANDTIAGDLDITGTGTIAAFTGTNTFFMGGDLRTSLSAVYAQTGAGTRVTVAGDASFAGGTSTNINNGILEVRGNFTQGPTGSTNAFQASGPHTTLLSYGPGALRRAVAFTNPGTTAGDSRFARLQIGRTIGATSQPVSVELVSNVQAAFVFDTSTIAAIDTIFTTAGNQATLNADTVSLSEVNFTTTRLVMGRAATGGTFAHQLSTATMSSMNTAQNFLTVHRTQGAPAVQLASVGFATTPTTGRYLVANTIAGGGGAPAVNIVASNVLGNTGTCLLVSKTGTPTPTVNWAGFACP